MAAIGAISVFDTAVIGGFLLEESATRYFGT